jgi:sec-independent protein translocase protein TatA
MPNLGATELIIILVIVVAIFGAGKLPELGGALGKGVKEFKDATREVESASNDAQKAVKDATAGDKA